MSLAHFPHQAIDGRWHAVYRSPGCNTLNSIGDALSHAGAQTMVEEANRDQARKARAAAEAAKPPAERKLVKGFYTDEDAA